VQFLSFFEALKSEAFGGEASGGNEADAAAQVALEFGPFFVVEFFGDAKRVLGALFFIGFERSEKLGAKSIVFWGQLFNPLFLYLRIANGAKAAEEFSGRFPHVWPGGIGVDLFHDGGERAAAANGDAKIVDGVWVRGGAKRREFFEGAVHPMGEVAVLGA
jgi:hypothetical protein